MSEDSPKGENKQETPPGDIDSLLAAAANSLAEVDEQLGQEDSAENQTAIQEKDADFTSPDNRVDKVDNTLDNLEQELNTLLDEVSENDKPQQVSEEDKPKQAGEDDSQNNIDDVLAELTEELEQDEPETVEDEKVSATDTPVTVENEPTPETDNIDDVLAELAEELEQDEPETVAAEQEKPQSVQPEESDGDTEIEQQSSQAETQISPDEDLEEAQNIIDKLPDIGGADKDDGPPAPEASAVDTPAVEQSGQAEPSSKPSEPTAETIPEADQAQPVAETDQASKDDQPAEEGQAVSEVDQEVMKELAEIEDKGKADEPAPATTKAEAGQNSRLNFPQRALVQSLETVNKPFEFVPDKTKDILGMIGVVTMIVSVIAAALILLIVD
jgi:hypothetical protein